MLLAQQNIAAPNIAMRSHYLCMGSNNDPEGFAIARLLLFFSWASSSGDLWAQMGGGMLEPFSGGEHYLQDCLWTTGTRERCCWSVVPEPRN